MVTFYIIKKHEKVSQR